MSNVLTRSCCFILLLLGSWTLVAQRGQAEPPKKTNPLLLLQPGATPSPLVLTQRALTVVGQGQVTVPADRATLEFQLGSRSNLSAPELPGVSLPSASTVTPETLQPLITALRESGVKAEQIELQTSPLESPRLLVTLLKPTREQVQKVVMTVNQAVTRSQQLFLQSIGAAYSVKSCQPLEQSAQRLALADARRQMTPLAQALRMQVGEILLVTVLPLQGAASSIGCGSKVGVSSSFLATTDETALPPYNAAAVPEVKVRSQISVTYGMQ
ncbi:SIMPL domain-containing protein [Leptolyngbya sp. FACHB-321]|uniref:SIMPL domain-containing protein n=1 Tax=Leptolyngbya sp. FACHB-321 TaxID=2692807 RepID=UPI001688D4E5|nr:SIMPL domain-containing protein [Leptolyngbya sp. FACHB-321]MBD2036899.1 SIMPL domain-containing protein [Leptolyngbya sp. FACHB-321]